MSSLPRSSAWGSERIIIIVTIAFITIASITTIAVIFFSWPVTSNFKSKELKERLIPHNQSSWYMYGSPGKLTGVYSLTQFDENYEKYLLAMDISHEAVPYILAASELLVVEEIRKENSNNSKEKSEDEDIRMQTVTDWVTRSMEFRFNTNFNITYGNHDNSGVLHNFCVRPVDHVIQCTSEEKIKKWRFEFDFIFFEEGMVNNRYFINKNIAMRKVYRREPEPD